MNKFYLFSAVFDRRAERDTPLFMEIDRNALPILDYRTMLKEEYESRKLKYPKYSIRSYAKSLEISPSFLSQVFLGKRNLSLSTAGSIVSKLKWPRRRERLFLNIINHDILPGGDVKRAAYDDAVFDNELAFNELSSDQFKLVSEWQHFAIVELIQLKNTDHRASTIARRLGISLKKTQLSIDRLLRVGLIARHNSRLKKSTPFYRVQGVPSRAIRAYHSRHMRRALKALETIAPDQRDITGTTLAIDSRRMPEFKELIKKFRDQLNQITTASDSNDRVYQLAIQFFPLDRDV